MSDNNGTNTGWFGIPPGGPWFVFPLSGTIQRQDNKILAAGLAAAGWIGFPTKDLAETYAHTKSIAAKSNSAIDTATGYYTKIIDELTNPKTWLRVIEVLIGLGLIVVGVVRMTGQQENVKDLAKLAAVL